MPNAYSINQSIISIMSISSSIPQSFRFMALFIVPERDKHISMAFWIFPIQSSSTFRACPVSSLSN